MPKRKARSVEPPSSEITVSVGQWMLLQFVTILPIVGAVVVLVMAFVGENRTRKNFYRALIAWVLLFLTLHFLLFFSLLSAPTLVLWTSTIVQWCKDLWAAFVDVFP